MLPWSDDAKVISIDVDKQIPHWALGLGFLA